jgi:hypothetical protein
MHLVKDAQNDWCNALRLLHPTGLQLQCLLYRFREWKLWGSFNIKSAIWPINCLRSHTLHPRESQ